MATNYKTLKVTYKWHEIYNKLPFESKCPFCRTITTILDKTKNVEHKCDGEKCDGVFMFV